MSDFTGEKAWYLSRGVLGPVLGVITIVAGLAGYTFGPEEQEVVMLALMSIGGALGNLTGAYGRVKATKKIK